MFGYPGSGKTHFASQFAQKHSFNHISGDRLRYELFNPPEFTESESKLVERIMDYILEQAMKTKTSIIYDANNGVRTKRRELTAAANKRGFETLIVWTQTDLNTAFMRASSRDKRRHGDRYSFNVDEQTFNKALSKIKAPDREEYVVVSGKYDFPAQELTVLKKLAKLNLIEPLGKSPSRFARSKTTANPKKHGIGGRRQFTI